MCAFICGTLNLHEENEKSNQNGQFAEERTTYVRKQKQQRDF